MAKLGQDQAAAVRRLTQNGDAVACVVGPAGTGKTRTMGVAEKVWANSGLTVRGLTLSAVAAGVLQAEAGIPSDTAAKFLNEQGRAGGPAQSWRLKRGEVVVVVEAGMVSSPDLARVVEIADRAHAKVVLVGDHAQLGAIEAGGLFRLLARHAASELSEVHRFGDDWEAAASLRLRDRDQSVLEVYEANGRVSGGDRLAMIDEAFARWEKARAAGELVVMCAGDHATVDALATRARTSRVAAGEVESNGLMASGHIVGIGDEIVTTRNERRLVSSNDDWVRNGDRWNVIGRGDDGSLLVESDQAGRVLLPHDYVTNDVTLGYAVTVHKAQGITVDHSILIVDDNTASEALYVAMTRGRLSNTALAVQDDFGAEDHVSTRPDPRHVLAGALGRVSDEQAALDVLAEQLETSESLATLAPRLANLDAWIASKTPPDRTDELKRIERRIADVESRGEPGWLTANARRQRDQLTSLSEERAKVEVAQSVRSNWFEAHEETFSYRQELADAVERRRHELGLRASIEQPGHVVDRLGPLPDHSEQLRTWTERAAHIEAYREEWNVDARHLNEIPKDNLQYQQWWSCVGCIEASEVRLVMTTTTASAWIGDGGILAHGDPRFIARARGGYFGTRIPLNDLTIVSPRSEPFQ